MSRRIGLASLDFESNSDNSWFIEVKSEWNFLRLRKTTFWKEKKYLKQKNIKYYIMFTRTDLASKYANYLLVI